MKTKTKISKDLKLQKEKIKMTEHTVPKGAIIKSFGIPFEVMTEFTARTADGNYELSLSQEKLSSSNSFQAAFSLVQKEIDKMYNELLAREESDEKYQLLYAARQALAWVVDPSMSKSPFNMIMDIRGSE